MRWLICGTVPYPSMGLTIGQAGLYLGCASSKDGAPQVYILDQRGERSGLPVNQGTPALLGAFVIMADILHCDPPEILLAGDDGNGDGSRLLYRYLRDNIVNYAGYGITFHYFLPDVDEHNRLLIALEDVNPRPLLCADAGFMYAAKMSGYASVYDLFTPDAGELAFLADENAPHPFYTQGFLLADDDNAPELSARAHSHGNAAKIMLVKGKTDYVIQEGQVIHSIDVPQVPALEAVGGTGDSVAGIASALLAAGLPISESCRKAALTNRFMGQLANPTPAASIAELLCRLPKAWEKVQNI
ncbi:MAG: sugar kinase [Desulfovibrio sp.]|jgi:hypothetical protein|nr:sugar kinase [Desulfovibrio sp.]